MQESTQLLLSLGCILLVGQLISTLGANTYLPRVSLLLIFGIAVGSDGLALIPSFFYEYFNVVAEVTLLMVGFLIGGKMTKNAPHNTGFRILVISICAAVVTVAVVMAGLVALGFPLVVCIILACIAAATDPVATLDTIMESNDDSRFSRMLILIVALDDAWALILFSIGLAVAVLVAGNGTDTSIVMDAIREILGAVALGLSLGLAAANLTGRLKPGEPMLTEAIGLVLICGGLSSWLNVSFLIAAMAMGGMIARNAKHHEYAFHEIENIEWPFLVIFFVLAGATLEFGSLENLGIAALVYVVCRSAGKIIGAWIGGRLAGAGSNTSRWAGMALLPQAGVAIGMALVASNEFPQYRELLLPLAIGTTIFFEVVGPVFTRRALERHAAHD